MTQSNSKSTKQKPNIQLRLDDELQDYLTSQAKAAYRTLTAEIRMRLERSRQAELNVAQSKAQP